MYTRTFFLPIPQIIVKYLSIENSFLVRIKSGAFLDIKKLSPRLYIYISSISKFVNKKKNMYIFTISYFPLIHFYITHYHVICHRKLDNDTDTNTTNTR